MAVYKKRMEAEALAQAQKAAADGHAEAARLEAQGSADAVKIKAKAEAEAAELQAMSITKLAEANREAGLKEAEVLREKIAAANAKTREILLQETAQSLIQNASAIIRELVKPGGAHRRDQGAADAVAPWAAAAMGSPGKVASCRSWAPPSARWPRPSSRPRPWPPCSRRSCASQTSMR